MDILGVTYNIWHRSYWKYECKVGTKIEALVRGHVGSRLAGECLHMEQARR